MREELHIIMPDVYLCANIKILYLWQINCGTIISFGLWNICVLFGNLLKRRQRRVVFICNIFPKILCFVGTESDAVCDTSGLEEEHSSPTHPQPMHGVVLLSPAQCARAGPSELRFCRLCCAITRVTKIYHYHTSTFHVNGMVLL